MIQIGPDFKFSKNKAFQGVCEEYCKAMFGVEWWKVVTYDSSSYRQPTGGMFVCKNLEFSWNSDPTHAISHLLRCRQSGNLQDPSPGRPACFEITDTGVRVTSHCDKDKRKDQPYGMPAHMQYGANGKPQLAYSASGRRFGGIALKKLLADVRERGLSAMCNKPPHVVALTGKIAIAAGLPHHKSISK